MADTPAGPEPRATRVALAVVFGVTFAAVTAVLLALALDGPGFVAAGAIWLGLGIVVVTRALITVGARSDRAA
jgi:hypothetical protein